MITIASSMEDLLSDLELVEKAQYDIKSIYARAAEKDLNFIELKEKELKIRRLISSKIHGN